MAFMKPKEVVQDLTPSSSIKLSAPAKERYQKVLAGFKSGFNIYDMPFQDLFDAMD